MTFIYCYATERAKSPNGSVTFRFDNEILSKLRNEADQRISLNTLANQLFQSYIEYDMYASRAGMISFPKSLLVRIMDILSEQEVEQLSQYIAKNEIKEMILLVRNEYNLPAFLDMIESWLRGIRYRRDVIDSVQTFVIQHDMGERWPTYFEKLIKYVFKDLIFLVLEQPGDYPSHIVLIRIINKVISDEINLARYPYFRSHRLSDID